MAYQPTLNDIPQSGFQPSLGDLPENKPAQSGSFLDHLRSFLPEQRMPLGMDVASGLMSLGFPKDQREIVRNLPQIFAGQQPNMPEKFAQGVGEYLPLSMTGMGALRGVPGMLARVGATGAYGAATNPSDRQGGLEQGLAFGAGGEAIPAALSGVGRLAEAINPKGFTNKMADVIKTTYDKFKNEAHDIYEGLKTKHADSNIYQHVEDVPSLNYSTMGEGLTEYFSPVLKKMHAKFIENPSYENAQDLQSQMGSYIRKIKSGKVDAHTQNAIESVGDAREALNIDLLSFLKKTDKNDFNQYSKARDITRDILSPHENNPVINKVVKGRNDQLQPNELFGALKTMTETGKLPPNHYMNTIKSALGSKISRGNLINNVVSLGAGAGIGEMFLPGAGGVSSGLTGGGIAAKFLSPVAVDIAQNPYFLKMLGKLNAPYNAAKSGIIGSQLQESND